MTQGAVPPDPGPSDILHASCVALNGRGLLIIGASGSGKSGLALTLMAFGANLIADDRTRLHREGSDLIATPAPNIHGLIEANGVGLLNAEVSRPVPIRLVVDLDTVERKRLPDPKKIKLLGCAFPLLHKVESPHFAPAILQYLKAGAKAVT